MIEIEDDISSRPASSVMRWNSATIDSEESKSKRDSEESKGTISVQDIEIAENASEEVKDTENQAASTINNQA